MSPTSYQAAPPRTPTIADALAPVKFRNLINEKYRERAGGSQQPVRATNYQVLYGVPSTCDAWSEFECTSSTPTVV